VAQHIYTNEDLSPEAAKLAFEARQRRRQQRSSTTVTVHKQTSDEHSVASGCDHHGALVDSNHVWLDCSCNYPIFYCINATSLKKNNALQLLHTDALNHNADFILVDETWFTDKQCDADVSLPGFNLFRSDRKSRIGGGVCIYVHSKYQDCNIIYPTSLVSNLEILWLQCTIQTVSTQTVSTQCTIQTVSTQTGIKRRSKILELELLQEQSILTIKQ